MSYLAPLYSPIEWVDETCSILDQRKLPSEFIKIPCSTYSQVVDCIQSLAIRGAPAIGIAGAFAVTLAVRESLKLTPAERHAFLKNALYQIARARPTAVNLKWAVERMSKLISRSTPDKACFEMALAETQKMYTETASDNDKIASFGSELLPKTNRSIITHCNTGGLGTIGCGTAFGVILEGFRMGRVPHVFPCETRPVNQGSRLTVWELQQHKIPFTLICDSMAASLMQQEKISAVIVGADRIVSNGDTANKVGTYNLAVLCAHHAIPFYVAAPFSSFDLSMESGQSIPIEERSPEEILSAYNRNQPNFPVSVYNPAFDITPNNLITSIICERGVITPPFKSNIMKLAQMEGAPENPLASNPYVTMDR